MSLSLSQKVDPEMPFYKRAVMAYCITDEVFALASMEPDDVSFPFFGGLMLTPILGWTSGTLLGAIASNLPEVSIANLNPDTVESAAELDGTDVGVIRGELGVAENGCIWVPQAMKEKAVCFISENLIILLPKSQIVNNMHEAYKRIEFDETYDGYGTFISGPSKTADIAQVLVMGAQAARSATILLMPE
jgi:hypothetical protein